MMVFLLFFVGVLWEGCLCVFGGVVVIVEVDVD